MKIVLFCDHSCLSKTLSPSQDLTAAWYAAAPPPPPPQAKGSSKRASMAAQNTYSNHADTLRTSSSSTSLSFDKRMMGDDLPRDSHSPAPERPVSRNAMAKQRERERQRARTNSTSGQPEDGNYQSQQSHHLHSIDVLPNRSPSPGLRNRRESSPAAAGQWSTYLPAEQSAQQHPYNSQIGQSCNFDQQNAYGMAPPPPPPVKQAYPPSSTIMQQPIPSYGTVWAAPPPTSPSPGPQYTTPAPQQFVQQSPMQPPQSQQQYNGYPAGYVSAPQTPSQFAQGYWPQANGQQPVYVAEPMSMPQTPVYAGVPTVNGQGQWIAQQQQSAPVPFPTSTAMPPPPVPVNQPMNGYGHIHPQQQGYPSSAYGTPPTANGRPLPSPSRTSSQSSSVGTRASTTSLGSVSGTVRRSLPQPPQGRSDSNPQPILSGHTTVRQSDIPASLGRHESVRMAAEEIMSRGLPNRRKGLPSSMRTQSGASSVHTHANSSRSDGSITDGTLPGTGPKPSTPVSITPRNRAESASCLENEMRSMKLQDNNEMGHANSRSNRIPFAPVQPSVNGYQNVSVPAPSSNEHVRASSPRPIRAAPSPDPEVTISSPMEEIIPRRPLSRGPKDERERRRSMEIQAATAAAAAAAKSAQVPSITVDDGPMIPTISFDQPAVSQSAIPTIMMPEEEEIGPSIQISEAPQICISEENEAEKPTGTISISVSSAGLAQRSTSSNNIQSQAHHNVLPRQRTASKPFAAPAPASAPSIGSGAACATCQKWIGGRVVHAMSHTFHPDCFVCSHCSEALEHVAFYEHEGRPYCHFDFHELFSKRCFHCRTPIVDQRYITINDVELVGNDGTGETQERCYHDMHFFCANCGDPFLDPKLASSAAGAENAITAEIEDEDGHVRFGGREFVVHKGYPYCEHCHVSLHKPKCKGCKKPIIDEEYLTALRGKWHIGCFCCERCQHPIDSDNFFVRDGQAYDEECYKIKLRSEL